MRDYVEKDKGDEYTDRYQSPPRGRSLWTSLPYMVFDYERDKRVRAYTPRWKKTENGYVIVNIPIGPKPAP